MASQQVSQNTANHIIMCVRMSPTPAERIAVIGPKGIPKDFSGAGGIETYVEDQLLAFAQKGYHITCYVHAWTSPKRMDQYHGIERVVVPTIHTISLDTLSYSFLASVHASLSGASIVWYHGIGPSFFSFIPKLFGKRVYITIHALDWKRKKWGAFARFFLRLSELVALSFSNKLFVVSNQLRSYYQKHYHRNAVVEKYAIPNRKIVQPDIIRKKYQLKKNTYVLFLGRFVPEKRLEWLIQAADSIKNRTIVLSGESNNTDAYVQYLKKLAINKNVLFTEYVFGKEKFELISNCRLFVLPSALEGFPVTVVEALAYKKHCLVGDFLKPEYPPKNTLVHYFRKDSFVSFFEELKRLGS